jgi:alpha 1,2-mannosyltransferase
LDEYDWFMRIDTDSFILEDINYNVFEYMVNKKKIYGYIGELPEWPPVCKDIDFWIEEFIHKHNIPKTDFYNFVVSNGTYSFREVYNNFEITSKEYYNTPQVKFMIDEFNKSGNIYRLRWGDHLLKTLILSLCFDRNRIHRFSDIGYHHTWFHQRNGVCTTSLGSPMKEVFYEWRDNNNWLSL